MISLAASSAERIPRSVEFLYSRNRLNVAVSRAQCLTILVASPALLSVTCRTVEPSDALDPRHLRLLPPGRKEPTWVPRLVDGTARSPSLVRRNAPLTNFRGHYRRPLPRAPGSPPHLTGPPAPPTRAPCREYGHTPSLPAEF
jgi:hypothetical protein